MELPAGYQVQEVASPVMAKDVRKWYRATAPDGTQSLNYSSIWAAAKTAYEHEALGRWPGEEDLIVGLRGVPSPGRSG